MMDVDRFRETLKRHRNARRWSQERLALEAEMDHSLISRLESGQRDPTRDAISKLAPALGLTARQHDELLILAGHTPNSAVSLLTGDPELAALYELLHDDSLAEHTKDHIRNMLRDLAAIVDRHFMLKAVA